MLHVLFLEFVDRSDGNSSRRPRFSGGPGGGKVPFNQNTAVLVYVFDSALIERKLVVWRKHGRKATEPRKVKICSRTYRNSLRSRLHPLGSSFSSCPRASLPVVAAKVVRRV